MSSISYVTFFCFSRQTLSPHLSRRAQRKENNRHFVNRQKASLSSIHHAAFHQRRAVFAFRALAHDRRCLMLRTTRHCLHFFVSFIFQGVCSWWKQHCLSCVVSKCPFVRSCYSSSSWKRERSPRRESTMSKLLEPSSRSFSVARSWFDIWGCLLVSIARSMRDPNNVRLVLPVFYSVFRPFFELSLNDHRRLLAMNYSCSF